MNICDYMIPLLDNLLYPDDMINRLSLWELEPLERLTLFQLSQLELSMKEMTVYFCVYVK